MVYGTYSRSTSAVSVNSKPMLGRLQLGRMRRQKQRMDVLRYTYLGTVVTDRAVKHQHDLFGRAGPDRARKPPIQRHDRWQGRG